MPLLCVAQRVFIIILVRRRLFLRCRISKLFHLLNVLARQARQLHYLIVLLLHKMRVTQMHSAGVFAFRAVAA